MDNFLQDANSNVAFAFSDTLEVILLNGSWKRDDGDQESPADNDVNTKKNESPSESPAAFTVRCGHSRQLLRHPTGLFEPLPSVDVSQSR